MSSFLCCDTPKITPGARFCRACGAAVATAPTISAPAIPLSQSPATSVAASIMTPNTGIASVEISEDRFGEKIPRESLPGQRPSDGTVNPRYGPETCLMCGYICPAGTTNCPECDNVMGWTLRAQGGSEGGADLPSSPEVGLRTSTELKLESLSQKLVRSNSEVSDVSSAANSAHTVSDNEEATIDSLSQKPWYEGPMSRADAESALATVTEGSFLIRQRLNTDGLALALKTSEKVRHYLVSEQNGHWRLMTGSPSPFFPTIDELVEYYSRTKELSGVSLLPRRDDRTLFPSQSNGVEGGFSGSEESHRDTTLTGESKIFRKLTDMITSTERLFDLISLGNAILDAENAKELNDGELLKLRRSYRIRRSVLSYGCKKSSWQPNKDAKICQSVGCEVKFTRTTRRHHCRGCGLVMCKGCVMTKFERAGLKLTKICPVCYQFLSEVAKGRVKEAVTKFETHYRQCTPIADDASS